MVKKCDYCGENHTLSQCIKGLQLIKYIKDEKTLQLLSNLDLKWLYSHYKCKPIKFSRTNKRKKMVNQLLTMYKRNIECPICYENLNIKRAVITQCEHEFCDSCIVKHIINNNNCPICV